jgi:hypothetical protein
MACGYFVQEEINDWIIYLNRIVAIDYFVAVKIKEMVL